VRYNLGNTLTSQIKKTQSGTNIHLNLKRANCFEFTEPKRMDGVNLNSKNELFNFQEKTSLFPLPKSGLVRRPCSSQFSFFFDLE
jgi:hypothetical protein